MTPSNTITTERWSQRRACGLIARLVLTVLALLTVPAAVAAEQSSGERSLPLPAPSDRFETAVIGDAVLGVDEKGLILVYRDRSTALAVPTDAKANPLSTTKDAATGVAKVASPLLAQRRLDLGKLGKTSITVSQRWSGLDLAASDRALLLDGRTLALLEGRRDQMTMTSVRTVPWDLLRPAADSRGEPTRVETATTRAAFAKRYVETTGSRVVGMAKLPESLTNHRPAGYLLATRIRDFPLLLMECPGDEPSSCLLTRACNLEWGRHAGVKFPVSQDGFEGLAISGKRHLILIGEPDRRRILLFSYQSCFHLPLVGELKLPDRLRTLTALAIGADDSLWIVTKQQDDFDNAAVFRWPASSW